MELLSTIGSVLLTILSILWSVLWWFLSFFLMPLFILLIIAAIALRVAYRTPYLKPYVEKFLSNLGGKGLNWLKRLAYSLTVLPLRVLARFIWFSILHAWVNLWWRPRWTPWERAKQPPKP